MARVVTIKDVARAAGVSPMTVSRVLNNRPDVSSQTRQRVQDVIADLDYSPSAVARTLSQGSSSTIGVVSSGLAFYGPSRALIGIERQASEYGYSLMVRLLNNPLIDGGGQALTDLLANQVAGVIWAVAEIGDERDWLYDHFQDESTPAVFLSMRPRPDTSLVAVDNKLGGTLAAAHLLEQGCRTIGIITGPDEWWEARERTLGWQHVLLQAGQHDLERLVVRGDWTAAGGYTAMKTLLNRVPNLDGVFVSNDSMSLGALRAAATYGREVPHDLAVVGFDDIPESSFFSPPLTTVRQDMLEVGRTAVGLLNNQLEARANGQIIAAQATIVKPQLMVRQSSLWGAP